MTVNDEAISVGLSAADIAWPIVLAMCIALMILPFVFLLVGEERWNGMTRRADTGRDHLAERDLPGIGKAYSLETLDGARLLAVVHQSSRRDVYVTPPGAEEPTASVELSDEQARQFGAALAGASTSPKRSSRWSPW